jgi:DNA-binding response OmpR family regulator
MAPDVVSAILARAGLGPAANGSAPRFVNQDGSEGRVERAAELAARPAARLVVGDLVVDTGTRRVVAAGEEVHLTPTEFDLLARLATAPGDVLTRERLLADVWDWAEASGTRTVDSHVKALRAKIGADRVRTVHGVGYALEVPGR